MTCKDCIHRELCADYVSSLAKIQNADVKYISQWLDEIEGKKNQTDNECEHFADRSRFVELPCKVGDILYHPVPLRNMIAEYKIKSFQIYPHCVWVNWTIVDGVATINTPGIYANEISETVFFTKEAAEQALKECKKDE